MSEQPKWLQTYYGTDWSSRLHPTVFRDGQEYAIVRLSDGAQVGFVLVRKNGRHGVTPQQSLHEGPPSAEDLDRMEKKLRQVDG